MPLNAGSMPRTRRTISFLLPAGFLFLKEPQGPGVRYDGGIYGGWDVPIYYDPILAKLIVWAEDREMACRRMAAALDDFVILGIHTTIGFLKDIINHPEFRAGRTNTAFIKKYFDGWKECGKNEDKLRLALAAAAFDDLAAETRPGGRSGPGSERRRRNALEDIGPVEDRRSRVSWNLSFSSTALCRKISLEKKEKTYRPPGWRDDP